MEHCTWTHLRQTRKLSPCPASLSPRLWSICWPWEEVKDWSMISVILSTRFQSIFLFFVGYRQIFWAQKAGISIFYLKTPYKYCVIPGTEGTNIIITNFLRSFFNGRTDGRMEGWKDGREGGREGGRDILTASA